MPKSATSGGTAFPSSAPYRFQKYPSGGNCSSFGSSSVFTNLLPGTYTFNVKDKNGCLASVTTAVPANFGGGAGDRSEIENSVIEKTPEILTVFPNPNFGEMLFVNAENLPEENVRVLIINTLGEVFRTWRIENWLDAPLAIPLENLAAGTYYLSMETKMGATRTARFVIVSTEK